MKYKISILLMVSIFFVAKIHSMDGKRKAEIKKIHEKQNQINRLFSALAKGDLDSVKNIIATNNINIDITNEDGDTPLFFITNNHKITKKQLFDISEYLIKKGAKVNFVHRDGSTVLMNLAQNKNENLKLAKLLIKNGANIELLDRSTYGHSNALMYAIDNDNMKIAKYLIYYGASAELRIDRNGGIITDPTAKNTKCILDNSHIAEIYNKRKKKIQKRLKSMLREFYKSKIFLILDEKCNFNNHINNIISDYGCLYYDNDYQVKDISEIISDYTQANQKLEYDIDNDEDDNINKIKNLKNIVYENYEENNTPYASDCEDDKLAEHMETIIIKSDSESSPEEIDSDREYIGNRNFNNINHDYNNIENAFDISEILRSEDRYDYEDYRYQNNSDNDDYNHHPYDSDN